MGAHEGANMTRIIRLAFLAAVVLSTGLHAWAKRAAPAEVEAVTLDGVEYRVPAGVDQQGYIDAYDVKSSRRLWSRQVYVAIKDPELEGDVQDVFITATKLDGRALQITNEKGFEYHLDL